MEDNLSNEILEQNHQPFKDCYNDPTFLLDDDGEIVGYVDSPEDWALEFLHLSF